MTPNVQEGLVLQDAVRISDAALKALGVPDVAPVAANVRSEVSIPASAAPFVTSNQQ